jgi:ABC-2 type transport system permease protein
MKIIGMLTAYTGTAITMWVMLYQFKALGSWTFYEMLFLFALSILSWGFCIILFFHFKSLDTYILDGTFDRFLVRPINPFFHFMAMKFDIASFGQFLFSILAFLLVSIKLDLSWSFGKFLFLVMSIVGGVLIQGGLLVMISAIAFWTTKSERFYWVAMYPARNLTYYPLMIYPKVIQWVTAFVIPFGFVNYFPAVIILEKETPFFPDNIGYFSPLVGVAFFFLSYLIWMAGLNRYKSAGS